MGSDLFGSYAESTCAALFVASISSFGSNHDFTAMSYPLITSSMGIVVSLITTIFATDVFEIKKLLGIAIGIHSSIFELKSRGRTEYYTSNAYSSPVQDVADSCRTGATTNVIFGLALGYNSVIIPIFAIATSIYMSFRLAAMYGIAMAALGILSTIATGLAIDAYGPISDNAGGIAEMAGMSHSIRERTDALDAAGNTTAAIGKGFAIGSAALVFLALFGAYVSRAGIEASAVLKMVEEVCRQFNSIQGLMEGTSKPDYANCVKISTDASLREMIPPSALVMLTPLIVGVLGGSLVSGVQVAISASNTGGAWDNAKKYIEAGASEHVKSLGPKGSDCHKAAVIGDTIVDPLKDTSGPSFNIHIKLMTVESWVFAPFFAAHGGLLFKVL
ncbi:Pyrophosphate-energized vacuolar membrane proton pump [Hibiscus syriacus]|uniref:H(+)-exporting diphosphatase n=1 Tax=Hibiscus syriacus TaxID=106335 RepID=A0A6A2YPD3_HIBSY|nr:Pyrophosphate-energized vacuolar membrane proton pump [Hibiscus syriacus]